MIKEKTGRPVLVLILIAGLFKTGIAQSLNYAEIFGGDWQKALAFVEKNNIWIKPALKKYNIPYEEAVAVVFPELVRYSALRDKMETALLKTLYRNLGDDYADFSIGVFQVKPSFAEKIRDDALVVKNRKIKNLFKDRSAYPDERAFRASIVADLENPKTELDYIVAFLKICENRFVINRSDEASKIEFLATAYNTGFWKSSEEIEAMIEKKFFNTKLFKTENYSYADVALFWYNQYLQTTFNSER
ncbi:MAG: hypothetical protein NTZ85_11785 [Bacteroidia bacterium]|nr:hypothetical protein [Bacteroidia bacterium]